MATAPSTGDSIRGGEVYYSEGWWRSDPPNRYGPYPTREEAEKGTPPPQAPPTFTLSSRGKISIIAAFIVSFASIAFTVSRPDLEASGVFIGIAVTTVLTVLVATPCIGELLAHAQKKAAFLQAGIATKISNLPDFTPSQELRLATPAVDRQNRSGGERRNRTGLDEAVAVSERCRPKAQRPAALCGPRDREASRQEPDGGRRHRGELRVASWMRQAARREYR
jgi:hypothetical protein